MNGIYIDTAECYTGVYPDGSTAYNEEIVGGALRTVRDKVIIATKCGVQHGGDHLILDSSPETIRRSVEGSLRRLGMDYIDLYYQHRIDPKVEPEMVAETMAELIREGKIRAWGISEADEDYLRRAHAVCPVTAIQNRYSMIARWHEKLFPVVEELSISYVAFSPMAIDEFNGPRGDFYKNMFARCPAGRPGTADEVANVAELLMGPAGAFITGSTFLIDGGATASYFYGPLKPQI